MTFTDVDGNRFRDFNLGDMSVLAGWARPRAARRRRTPGPRRAVPAVARPRPRGRGEAGVAPRPAVVAFTLSATQANVEAVPPRRTRTSSVGRSGLTHAADLPRDAAQARATFDVDLFNLQRLYLINRGIWEAIDSAGPAVSLVATSADVDAHPEAFDAFLGELT
jgi:glutamate-1-semialdehyde aminotransferase